MIEGKLKYDYLKKNDSTSTLGFESLFTGKYAGFTAGNYSLASGPKRDMRDPLPFKLQFVSGFYAQSALSAVPGGGLEVKLRSKVLTISGRIIFLKTTLTYHHVVRVL
jgi:hypothetical protein